MRALRYVKKSPFGFKLSWCNVNYYTTQFFAPTRVVLSSTDFSQQDYGIEAQWDPLGDSSLDPQESITVNLKSQEVLNESTTQTFEAKLASELPKPEVLVSDSSGRPISIVPIEQFSDLKNMPEWLEEGLKESNFTHATSIQGHTIPVLAEGHDLIGLAPTGSGKTVAFAVPALKRFKPSASGFPTILVLAPTRELVQQTSKVFQRLSCMKLRICEAYGGAPREIQCRRLHNGCDVLIACPGRLRDFLRNGDVSLEDLSFLVFDEADRLLDMGFRVQLDEILSYADSSRRIQTMMWSATWPKAVEELANNYLLPERITIRAGTTGMGLQVNKKIKQHILFAEHPEERMDALVSLIQKGTIDENTAKMMMFVERQTDTDNAAHLLVRKLGIHTRDVGVIHGGMQQRQRDYIMKSFKNNENRILIATDVASRGLDFPDVTCVVNFIAPKNIDSYCHRIGRTGRAGRTGDSFTFIGRSDGSLAKELVKYLQKCGMDVPSKLKEIAERFTQVEEDRRYKRGWSRGGRENWRAKGRNNTSSTGGGW